jgi:hypothetical protein
MKITAEAFRRLLPTLQHVARFPGCNRQSICKRDGVSVEDLDALIVEACGSIANWDEEYLANLGADLHVPIPAYKPGGLPRSAPVVESRPVAPAPRAAVCESAPRAAATEPAGKWPWLKRSKVQPRTFEKHFPVLWAAAANPGVTLSEVCKKAGVKVGAFYMFRSFYFAGIEVTPQHVELFRRWAAEKLGDRLPANLRPPASGTLADVLPEKAEVVEPLSPSRRRLNETTAAAASAAAKPRGKAPVASDPTPPRSAASTSSGDLIASINELIAGFRLEVLTVRLVPAAAGAGEVVES